MAGNDAVVNLKINADAIVQDINKVKRAIDKLSGSRGNKGKSIPKISSKVGKKLGEKPDRPLADTRSAKDDELSRTENLIKARAKLVALAQRELQLRAQVAQDQPNAKKPEDVFGRQEMPSFRKISTGAQQALGIKPGSKEEITFNKELKAAAASLSSKTSGLSLDDLVKDFKVKADKVLTGQGLPKSTTTTFQKDVIPQEPTPKAAKPKPAAAKPAAASGPAADSGPAASTGAKKPRLGYRQIAEEEKIRAAKNKAPSVKGGLKLVILLKYPLVVVAGKKQKYNKLLVQKYLSRTYGMLSQRELKLLAALKHHEEIIYVLLLLLLLLVLVDLLNPLLLLSLVLSL